MTNNLPNQVVDEITGVVYPPAEAIRGQCITIRSIANNIADIFDATNDIHSIQPNIKAIETILNYLKGAPPINMPEPYEPDFTYTCFGGMDIQSNVIDNNHVQLFITGDFVPNFVNPDLFGEDTVDSEQFCEFILHLNTVKDNSYHIVQYNENLAIYADEDPYVQYSYDHGYYKDKTYIADANTLDYSLLLGAGRNYITVIVNDKLTIDIITHFHEGE